jgi:hypothetical protein
VVNAFRSTLADDQRPYSVLSGRSSTGTGPGLWDKAIVAYHLQRQSNPPAAAAAAAAGARLSAHQPTATMREMDDAVFEQPDLSGASSGISDSARKPILTINSDE